MSTLFLDSGNIFCYIICRREGAATNKRIAEIRKEAGLSQEAFGARVGITGAAISRIESGHRTPSEPVIRAICQAFKVNYEWLTEGTGPMHTNVEETDAERFARLMRGASESKKQLFRIMSDMPDELLEKMVEYLEEKFK